MFYYVEPYPHRYPVCWRCGTELVFRLVDEWFIRMDPIRDLLMRVTENIRWVPEFGKARELDWLRNMDDWMISKKRYYGLALPILQVRRLRHLRDNGVGGRTARARRRGLGRVRRTLPSPTLD